MHLQHVHSASSSVHLVSEPFPKRCCTLYSRLLPFYIIQDECFIGVATVSSAKHTVFFLHCQVIKPRDEMIMCCKCSFTSVSEAFAKPVTQTVFLVFQFL